MAEYGFKTIEKKYGVVVEKEEEWWNPLKGKFCTSYKLYSADGCLWGKGYSSREAVKREILADADLLMRIKKNVEGR